MGPSRLPPQGRVPQPGPAVTARCPWPGSLRPARRGPTPLSLPTPSPTSASRFMCGDYDCFYFRGMEESFSNAAIDPMGGKLGESQQEQTGSWLTPGTEEDGEEAQLGGAAPCGKRPPNRAPSLHGAGAGATDRPSRRPPLSPAGVGQPGCLLSSLVCACPATPRSPSNPHVQDRNSEDPASEEPCKEPPRRHSASRPRCGAPRGPAGLGARPSRRLPP